MNKRTTVKHWLLGALLMILGSGMNACAMGDKTSWKEEVLLHDGKKIIVERSQTYGGRHEIGQRPPIKEQRLTFTLPGSNRSITWQSEYSEDIGRANLNPLALHILNGTPYIVLEPNLCLAYNKWGRPNPPYVIFKYDGKTWKRIPLSELPVEFKNINVVINTLEHAGEISRKDMASVADVVAFNSSLLRYPNEHAAYKTIVREPLKWGSTGIGCPDYSSPRYMSPKAPHPIVPSPKDSGSDK